MTAYKSKYVFEYSKLRGRIVEKFGTLSAFADFLHDDITEISAKLNANNPKRDVTKKDIVEWSEALEISKNEIADYFFTLKV